MLNVASKAVVKTQFVRLPAKRLLQQDYELMKASVLTFVETTTKNTRKAAKKTSFLKNGGIAVNA